MRNSHLPILLLFCFAIIGKTTLLSQNLGSSNLPILILSTNSQPIGFQKINASFKIVDNPAGQANHPADPPSYEGMVSIRLRGNYSASLPQKPYAIETLDAATGLDTSVALLGMPKEEDWILLAMWNDKSFVRNSLMFELARQGGQWAPHTRHVEVLLNGQYQGIYVFCEKIKRDGDRVDIAKLTPDDNDPAAITGGYIFRHDYGWDFATDNWHPQRCPDRWLNFEFEYPKVDEITQPQRDFLAGYLDEMEEALFSPNFRDPETGYRAFLDMDSWVDYFLLSELSGNVDAYKKSMYYHKDRDSLLKLGPIWDFDWALKFLGENGFPNGSGWLYTVDPCTQDVLYVPYFNRLMEDSFFQQRVCNRWNALRRTTLDTSFIFNYIDSKALVLDEAKTRHFQRWQCLGYDSGAPEAPPYPTTFAGEIEKLKRFLRLRISWMDTNLDLVACNTPTVEPDEPFEVNVMPNFGNGEFILRAKGIRSTSGKLPAIVFDARGIQYRKLFFENGDTPIDLTDLPSGVYFIKISMKPTDILRRLVVIR